MSVAERRALRAFLAEDLGKAGDVTSRAVLTAGQRATAHLIANDAGVVAGLPYVVELFRLRDRRVRVRLGVREGTKVRRGQRVAVVSGPAFAILAAERTALNLLGHLSGIATLTRKFVRRISGTRAAIYDTRKTLPGLRLFEKYAVRIGGGRNHRTGLHDEVLIKTNHLKLLAAASHHPAKTAIARARQHARRLRVTVEVATLNDFMTALLTRPDCILLDNLPLATIRRLVRLRDLVRPSLPLEVSGGVTLANVRAIAKTGVDRLSVGAITKNAPTMDFALRVSTRH